MGADIITTWKLKDEVSATANKIKKNVTDAGKTVKGSILSGVGLGAGISAWDAVAKGVRMATDELGQAVQMAIADEASQNRLYTALQQNVRGWDGNREAIEDTLRANLKYAFSVDEQRDSLARLVARTGDLNEALAIQEGAMDLARLRGISLTAASEALSKAMGGEKELLRSLGIEIGKNADAMDILAAVRKKAGGQKDTYAASAQGTFESLTLTLDQLKEDIGKELVPTLIDLAKIMKDSVIPAAEDTLGAYGHLQWAMKEQRKSSADLMFWQRGLLGVWTDSAYSSEAYAKALKDEAEQKRLNAVWTARMMGIIPQVASDTRDLTVDTKALEEAEKKLAEALAETTEKAQGLWDAFIEGTKLPDWTLDEQRRLKDLPLMILIAKDEVAEARKALAEAGTPAERREAELRLRRAKRDVADLTAELKSKTALAAAAAAGKAWGYSYGSALHAEVVRWNALTKAQMQRLGDYKPSGPGQVGYGPKPTAAGGPVWPTGSYLVGEVGPELFVPRTAGTIVPNNQLGGGSAPVNVAVYLDSEQIAARVERRQYFAASVAPVSAR